MRGKTAWRAGVLAALLPAGFAGCAAIPLAVIAGSLLEAGGGVIVKTGTEYSASGTALRTFNLPIAQVHAAVLAAFARTQIIVVRERTTAKEQRIDGIMHGRRVRVVLQPLTPVLTSMSLDVKRNVLASDKATASELLAQVERAVNDGGAAAAAHEPAPDDSGIRGARRGG